MRLYSKIAIAVSDSYNNDELFNVHSPHNRDDCLSPFRDLKLQIENKGGVVHTLDIYKENGIIPDVVIFSDHPYSGIESVLGPWTSKVESWLLLLENEIIIPWNWNIKNHSKYTKIFSWHDDFIDNKKYYKINYSQKLPHTISIDFKHKKKLCVCIAGNKRAHHKHELYSERLKVIKYCEHNHPNDFDLFGFGWDEYMFINNRIGRLFNRFSYLKKKFAYDFKTYRGPALRKSDVLPFYKYAICFENANGYPGYITEKIFDCFVSGTVPVYWGAPNISLHVPPETFIDMRKFDSLNNLFAFLKSIENNEYLNYLKNINTFLGSSKAVQFSSDMFVKTLLLHCGMNKIVI